MKKRIFAILFAVVLSLTMITTASAETTDVDDGANSTKTIGSIQGDRTLPLVVDNADLLNGDEEDKLNSLSYFLIRSLSILFSFSIFVLKIE